MDYLILTNVGSWTTHSSVEVNAQSPPCAAGSIMVYALTDATALVFWPSSPAVKSKKQKGQLDE
jgi:hypothetical protein